MHAYVHRETCIQCGLCPGVCPEVFSILPGESAQAITEPVPQEYLAAAQEAADSCPVAVPSSFFFMSPTAHFSQQLEKWAVGGKSPLHSGKFFDFPTVFRNLFFTSGGFYGILSEYAAMRMDLPLFLVPWTLHPSRHSGCGPIKRKVETQL